MKVKVKVKVKQKVIDARPGIAITDPGEPWICWEQEHIGNYTEQTCFDLPGCHWLIVVVPPGSRACVWIVRHRNGDVADSRGTAPTAELARWIALAVSRSPHAPMPANAGVDEFEEIGV